MVNILPFKGYRFNSKKIKDLGEVMAPPYDAISKPEQEELYKKAEHNIVRLNKGKIYEDDDETKNCFTRAAAELKEWIDADILVREEEPAFYLYEQTVVYKNTTYKNLGLVGLIELQDLNSDSIMQCERPNLSSKPARMSLLENTCSEFSMINCIYMEYEKTLMNRLNDITEKVSPDMAFKTHENIIGENVNQRVWVIKDPGAIKFIREVLNRQTFYIADGQTRYEVGLEYKKKCMERNKNHTGTEAYNYIMALFTNAFDDGLIQLPVHRLVRFEKRFSEDFFIALAQDYFKVEKIIVDTAGEDFVGALKKLTATARKENCFGLYCGGNYFYRLTLKDTSKLKELLPDVSDAYRSLDATVVTKLILNELMGIDEEKAAECVDYTTRTSYGVKAVRDGEFGALIVVNPVRAEQICGVAIAHERMPERSMFIFPKAVTGVVIYKMEEDVF